MTRYNRGNAYARVGMWYGNMWYVKYRYGQRAMRDDSAKAVAEAFHSLHPAMYVNDCTLSFSCACEMGIIFG